MQILTISLMPGFIFNRCHNMQPDNDVYLLLDFTEYGFWANAIFSVYDHGNL